MRDLILNNLKKLKPYLESEPAGLANKYRFASAKHPLKNKIEAFRLINTAHSHIPMAVDIYKNNAVIQVFGSVAPEVFKELEQALTKILHITDFFYKNRTKESIPLPAPRQSHKKIIVEEYDHKFLINLSDYLDTGLFLDHRETRKWIGSQSKNKIVLNTFAYAGSFSVYAGKAGAAKTYSVDLSKTYCEWIKKNLALNNLPPEKNWVYKMDTLEFFRYAKRKKLVFDVIIIDPPTFSKNKGGSFSVQKNHPELINSALKVLAPSGFILFSNNYKEFRMKKHALAPCIVSEKKDSIPPDFENAQPHRCFIIATRS